MTEPSDFAARWAGFRTVYEQEKFADALALLRAFPDEYRAEFQLVAHEADLLGKLGDPEAEIALLRQLIEQHPMIASLWASIANAQKTLGRTDEAVASLRHAIAIDPTYGKPWWQLSDLKRFRFDDADITTMERMLAGNLPPVEQAPLHFALAKAREDRGEARTAFDHYATGNALRREGLDYGVTLQGDLFPEGANAWPYTYSHGLAMTRDGRHLVAVAGLQLGHRVRV